MKHTLIQFENKTKKIPNRYLENLNGDDRKKQIISILKKTKRPKTSFVSKKSNWTKKFNNIYGDKINKLKEGKSLKNISKVTKIPFKAIEEVYIKGIAAYYNGGSRPNQTPQSWAYARVFSYIMGGNTRKVDDHITRKYNVKFKYLTNDEKQKKSIKLSGGRTNEFQDELNNLDLLITSYKNRLANIDTNTNIRLNISINKNLLLEIIEHHNNVNGNVNSTVQYINVQIDWVKNALIALESNPTNHNIDLIRDYVNEIYNVLERKNIEFIDYTNQNIGSNINDIVATLKSYLLSALESYNTLKGLLEKYHNFQKILDYLVEESKKKITIEKIKLKSKINQLVIQKKKLQNYDNILIDKLPKYTTIPIIDSYLNNEKV